MTFKYMVHVAYLQQKPAEVSAATATLIETTKTEQELRESYKKMVLENSYRYDMVIDIVRVG